MFSHPLSSSKQRLEKLQKLIPASSSARPEDDDVAIYTAKDMEKVILTFLETSKEQEQHIRTIENLLVALLARNGFSTIIPADALLSADDGNFLIRSELLDDDKVLIEANFAEDDEVQDCY